MLFRSLFSRNPNCLFSIYNKHIYIFPVFSLNKRPWLIRILFLISEIKDSSYNCDSSTPKKYPLSKPIINITYSSTHKLYAALELEEESHFNIKRIRIGHEFNDLCAWDCIQLNEEIGGTHFFRWVELAWVGNDLLLIDDAHLWKIKDAAIGGRVFERVSDINACGC